MKMRTFRILSVKTGLALILLPGVLPANGPQYTIYAKAFF